MTEFFVFVPFCGERKKKETQWQLMRSISALFSFFVFALMLIMDLVEGEREGASEPLAILMSRFSD